MTTIRRNKGRKREQPRATSGKRKQSAPKAKKSPPSGAELARKPIPGSRTRRNAGSTRTKSGRTPDQPAATSVTTSQPSISAEAVARRERFERLFKACDEAWEALGNSNRYLRPKEAAEIAGVTPRALRYWGREGWVRVRRTFTGHRRYHEGDIYRVIRKQVKVSKQGS